MLQTELYGTATTHFLMPWSWYKCCTMYFCTVKQVNI